jgi:hypothetical protein
MTSRENFACIFHDSTEQRQNENNNNRNDDNDAVALTAAGRSVGCADA